MSESEDNARELLAAIKEINEKIDKSTIYANSYIAALMEKIISLEMAITGNKNPDKIKDEIILKANQKFNDELKG